VANAGIDSVLCALTLNLYGNTPVTGAGAWTQVTGPGTTTFSDTTQPNTTATVTVQGTYTYRWAITNAGCPASADTVAINFRATPTVANAGLDRNLCQPNSTLNLAGNTPASGTGTWTQISGPSTAAIANAADPTTGVSGLNTVGTYTFVWTISNAPCLASTDTMTVNVNPAPPFFNVVGAFACQGSSVTLTGAANPGYTYAWTRSLSGINGTFAAFGGSGQTQVVTASGVYQLTTTNQFGCTMVDTATVHISDYLFTGSLAAGDAQLTNRINRFGQVSTCASPKGCPGVFSGTGARLFDSYTIVNKRNTPVCATVGLASGCGTNIFNVAYLRSFDPANPCTNYLGDPGSSFPASGFMEVTIPALDTLLIVVHEVSGGTGCGNYTLTVDMPRDPAAIAVSPTPPICSSAPVTLTGAVADTYAWTPGGATTQIINVSPIATTQYNVTYGYGNIGCTKADSTTVVIGSSVTTSFAGNDTATCGNTITLAANTPITGTGTWTQTSGPGTVTFGAASSPNSTATASANGVYKLKWTITAGAPCPGTSEDSVFVNFAGSPSVANAGVDRTACVSPGSATLIGNVPTVGGGSWTQVAGPVTTNIISPNAATTNITGLNTPGTYTFRWTISNNPCPPSFDEVNVVVNSNPAAPAITGGGTFCPPGTTLAGPVNPNLTYQWGRSFLAAPFTNLGTSQTQAVTASGNYQLTVTNQFGCSASAVTVVNVADYVFTGSLGAGDAQQTGRINRFAQISTCAAPKTCPGLFETTGARFFDSYTITNPRNVPVCATIGLNSGCGTAVFSAAYNGSFNPSAPCTNFLADPGSSPSASTFYEATIPANGTIVVVVHEVNPGQGCANYTLTVDLPRDLSPIVVNPPTVACASTATLTAPVASTYLWSPGGATTQSVTTPPLFTNTQYNVTLGYGNNGCTRADSVTVVVSSVPPTISCPANISLNNTTGLCGRAVTYSTTAGGTPTPALSYSFTGATTGTGSGNGSGAVFNVGVTIVTVTATNACGSVNCSFTVTITDNEAPIVTPGTIAGCYASVAAAEAAALAATSATDNCSGTLTETASTVGACSAVITVTTTDAVGNATAVSYNTRIDNTAPTVTTGTIGSCYASVAAAEAAALAATSATDNCPGALVETASTVGTCSAVITITTTDGCGNATSVTYNTRIDNTAPTVTAGTIGSCYASVAAAEAAALAATSATDNCPGALVETASTVGTCSAVITVTTTDGCGNATSVTYNTRIDNTAPTVTAGTIGSCYASVAAAEAAALAATSATDNCPGALVETASTVGTCSAVITVTTTDGCGNATSVTYNTRIDNTPPALTCPAAVTVCGTGAVPAVNIASVTNVTDNCPGAITVTHVGDVVNGFSLTTPYTVSRTYRATDGCGNFSECTQTITVNPIATVNAVSNQNLCNAAPTTAVTFSSPATGGTLVFNWTNTNTAIGLAASGSGAIPSFTAVNTGTAPITATITVTPVFTNAGVSCAGTPITYTYTVKPTPVVNAVANQVLCNGFATTAVNFSGPVSGTTYSWTNSAPSIGLAANGTGNIPAFTATNTSTTTPVVATITVTPSADGCTGAPRTFTITVNPTPAVSLTAFADVCRNAAPFTLTGGSPAGGVYFVNGVQQTVFNPANYTVGNHIILYRFTNSFGCVNTATQNIVVLPVPVPAFTVSSASGQCLRGNLFTFNNTTSGAVSYLWNFGDNTTSTSFAPFKTYTAAGTYTVRLTATNSSGCSETITRTVVVHPQPLTPVVIPEFGNGIHSSVVENSYLWFVDNVPIPNSNVQYFYPKVAGQYQVQVSTVFGCAAKSDSLFYIPEVFFAAGSDEQFVFVFPKPVRGDVLNVHFNVATKNPVEWSFYTESGQLLSNGIIPRNTRTYQINVKRYPSGAYVLRLRDNFNLVRGIVVPIMR
jgi:hypothetical protein